MTATSTPTPTDARGRAAALDQPPTAWLHVVARGGRTVVAGSRSGLPLGLRQLRTGPADGALRVGLLQTGAMLVGGDDVRLEVRVGPGAALILQDISATLAHPAGDDAPAAHQRLDVRVAAGGRAVLAEEPLVIAAGARLRRDVRIALEGDARLVHRDTLVLGRHGEDGGQVTARTRVERDGAAVLDDTLDAGGDRAVLTSAAVLGGARVIASLAAFGFPCPDAPDGAFALASGDTLVRQLARTTRELHDPRRLAGAVAGGVAGSPIAAGQPVSLNVVLATAVGRPVVRISW